MTEATFKDAWGVLQKHAQTLRNQSEPSIDDLLGIVTESVAAYKVCQSRVEAVELALEEALKGSGTERPAQASVVTPAAPQKPAATPLDDLDDDIPF